MAYRETGARFSIDRRYRYALWRVWDHDENLYNFLLLNPSPADEATNDPTIERCERRARRWGFGGLIVTGYPGNWLSPGDRGPFRSGSDPRSGSGPGLRLPGPGLLLLRPTLLHPGSGLLVPGPFLFGPGLLSAQPQLFLLRSRRHRARLQLSALEFWYQAHPAFG
jgi:hypothetical protein